MARSAASGIASTCRKAGWQVAVVDSRPFGGTCALRGCDPKLVLVGASEAIDRIRSMEGHGIAVGATRIDWPELMRFKRTFTAPVPEQREQSFAKAGIASFHGRARFVGPTAIRVEDDVLEARHVAVAAGARPATLGIPGEEHLTRSEQFLELDALPPRIIFIGGGYISFEFAHVAARAGTGVTILHRGRRPLDGFDPDLVDRLVERTRALGVEIALETKALAIERLADGLVVHAETQGAKRKFEAPMVVHGAGRVPEIDDLDLAAAGIEFDNRGVRVNEFLQSVSNPAVYAAGDAAASPGPPLTPVAGYEGRLVAASLLHGNQQRTNYGSVPSVVFTLPPLASVGLSERAAREQGLEFRMNHQETSGWYSSRRVGERFSGFKVLIEEGSDRILGAHLLGPHAEELINLFTLAMASKTPASQLRDVLFAYPTHASDLRYML